MQEATKGLDAAMKGFISKWHIQGASVAVVKDGALVYTKGFGYADREKNIAADARHTFRIASVSKLVTAVAIMKLQEEGKLTLEDKVFGPEGILNTDPYTQAVDKKTQLIEVKHLLLHTGGWSTRSYGDPMFQSLEIATRLKVKAPASEEAIIKYVMSKRLPYVPGTVSDYSNFGYFILSKVIEQVSGMPYEQYVQEAILHPLGIYDMQIAGNLYEDRAPNEVKYYDHEGAGKKISCYGTGQMVSRTYGGTDVAMLSGAGAWIASPASLMKLMVAIDGKPGKADILQPESIELMTTPQSTSKSSVMGWKSNLNGDWCRTGTLIGTNALLMHQQDGLSWVVITNTNHWTGPAFNNEIHRMMRQALGTVKEWPQHDLFDNYTAARNSDALGIQLSMAE